MFTCTAWRKVMRKPPKLLSFVTISFVHICATIMCMTLVVELLHYYYVAVDVVFEYKVILATLYYEPLFLYYSIIKLCSRP